MSCRMYFKDKTVWITGASSGIGEAVALALARQGARVVVSARSTGKLQELKARAASPENIRVVPLDLEDAGSIAAAVRTVTEKFGRVDILINNAGISQRATVLETPMEVDRRIMEVDYFGTVALTKALLPSMIEQGGGQIVCTSSMVGVFGFPLRSSYSAAKHALHGFFESLGAEYHDRGIKVGIVIGGRINTPISMSALAAGGTPYGRMDEGQLGGISPEKAARQILRGIRRGKREIACGGKELLMVRLKRWLPSLHFVISRKVKPT